MAASTVVETLRPRLHQDAGDLAAGRRDHAVRSSRRPVMRARRSMAVVVWPMVLSDEVDQRAGGPGGPAIIW